MSQKLWLWSSDKASIPFARYLCTFNSLALLSISCSVLTFAMPKREKKWNLGGGPFDETFYCCHANDDENPPRLKAQLQRQSLCIKYQTSPQISPPPPLPQLNQIKVSDKGVKQTDTRKLVEKIRAVRWIRGMNIITFVWKASGKRETISDWSKEPLVIVDMPI